MVGYEMRRVVCATVVLLIHVACSAQTPATSPLLSPGSDRLSTSKTEITGSNPLLPGEFATEKGWGQLQLNERSAALEFVIEDGGNKPFDGEWSATWCDKSNPKADCGGFNLGLVQRGNRLCGTYDSARARLSQIDEGGRVLGIAKGDGAVLTIESERSGGKYIARAMLDGDKLHWRLGETVRKADRDIDIIAIDERLDRRPLQGAMALKHAEIASDCESQRGNQ